MRRLLEELARELRQFTGLGASFFRAAATRTGMTVTDMQVIDILDSAGPTTAGQLADLTGLTTGAITGMLNRLEEAGLVRRERDPERWPPGHRPARPGQGQHARDWRHLCDSLGRRGMKWQRTTTMSRLPSCWSFSNAATRCPGGKLPSCERRRGRGGNLLRSTGRSDERSARLPHWDLPAHPCVRTTEWPNSTRPALKAPCRT